MKSLMNDVKNVIADPAHANDNPELPLVSHSQDDIQAPWSCELATQNDDLSSEKENVQPL